MVVLGPDRDIKLGITPEGIKARVERNKKLHDPIDNIAIFLAEGQGMADGFFFSSGSDLAYFLKGALNFTVAALMEQGNISKKLPGKSAVDKKTGPNPEGYL